MKFSLLFIVLLCSGSHRVVAIGGIDTPPAPAPPRQASFVRPTETRLGNGLRVIVAQRPGLPLLAAEVVIRSGAELDPAERAGATSMTGSLLTKGTEKMSAPEIATTIESLGGAISSGASWDVSNAGTVVMSDKAEPALAILSDVVLHPSFKQEEIDRLKKQILDSLTVAMQQPGSVAEFVRAPVVFGSSGYGHSTSGTIESVRAIQRDDIVKLYQNSYRPENAVLILVGNITLDQGKAYAQKFFGEWKPDVTGQGNAARALEIKDWKPTTVVVDMPQVGQAAVTVAKPAIKRSSPDFYAGMVTNAALGNGMASRLNREIRIKRGLSYGVRSSLEARREVGPFTASAQTKNESAPEVAELLQSELKRLGTEPVKGEELTSRQAMLIGNYARSMETNQGVAAQISSLATYNLPLETLDKFIPSINAVKTKDVTAFAAKYFATPASLIIAGKAADFVHALKKDFPDSKVIPQADLDLDRPDLVKQK